MGHRDPGSFRAATRKERTCSAAERGPDPFGHTRALQGPFFDPKTQNPKARSPKGLEQPHEKKGGDLEIGTWPKLKCTLYEQNLVSQNQPYFSRFMEGQSLEQPHEKNDSVLLQNVAWAALGTQGPRMV